MENEEAVESCRLNGCAVDRMIHSNEIRRNIGMRMRIADRKMILLTLVPYQITQVQSLNILRQKRAVLRLLTGTVLAGGDGKLKAENEFDVFSPSPVNNLTLFHSNLSERAAQ